MTPTLHIPVGIPGCGKSTFASEHLNFVHRVSSDEIRVELYGSLANANDPVNVKQNNRRVFGVYHSRIAGYLGEGQSVFADATNLDTSSRRKLRSMAQIAGAGTHAHVFTDLPRAYNQNYSRRDEDSYVPEHVMDSMALKLIVAVRLLPFEHYTEITWRGGSPGVF